jgi:DNA gyrase subunit B
MLASEQVKNLVIALGTGIGETFDITKLRYHKIIIATDADVDGAHIRTLLLTFFYRYLRLIVDGGYLYIAQAPLFKLVRGKEIHYVFSDEEKNKIIGKQSEELDTGGDEDPAIDSENPAVSKVSKWRVQRYKGLGEMNAEELKETTMDVKNRILKKVTIIDAAEADQVFDMFMGTDVSARKSYITNNAKLAELDI